MKFWQKIYVFSILGFVIVFNAASIMVIERSHTRMLQGEINSALSQNMSIHSTVDAVVPIFRIYDSIDYEKTVLTRISNEFVSKNPGAYLDIRDEEGREIFSNIDFQMPSKRSELDGVSVDQINYVLRDIDDRTILFTSNIADINGKSYLFTYMMDVTPVYQDRVEQYQFFIKVDVAACIVFMIFMFFVSRRLTRSIEQLSRTAQVIAKGNFSERVHLNSKDEVGIMAHNFNVMAGVVEDKITHLERNNEQKQRFINHFTHELKTPLTSIIAYSNFMRTTKYNEELFLEGLNVIYSEGKRLESLSLKLMNLIMMQGDNFQLERHDLGSIIVEMQSTLTMMAQEKRVKIIFECEHGELQLEQGLIKVLIFNLMDNAIKASDEEGTIILRTIWHDGSCILEVIDQGIGIAMEHQNNIFEPFYMVDKSRTRSRDGAGLGLSICQSIANVHNAVITVKSTEGEGTIVEVLFAPIHTQGGMEK
ncbi:HAMP domain-containing histidine kinase [Paenibacillus sp. N3/727]|uniref:HAMP domain-containing sensor histidine kinase n=1 Tax=Paenibacillus sp. N3/727 TaxID=2925845 RepID=UPI001F531B24|nr:HAMP domain-containing sensor histidine kinase [Paenibacillus sp. N3/727]UNK19130.1 HAMP domain-containing histidine kinase [Paenibacillus sp. N3/727]